MPGRGFIRVCVLAGAAAAAAALAGPADGAGAEPFVSIRFVEPQVPYLSGLEQIVLAVEVPDGDRIDRIDLFIDGELTHEARRPPFRFEHDFGPVGKAHLLLALAFTRNGLYGRAEFRSRPVPIVHQVEVKLVQLTATVVGPDGTYITDLGRDDFRVFENGVEQEIAFFDRGETPCSIALALDCSGSMKHRLWRAQKAAADFLRELPPRYRISVMGFNDTVFLAQDFTTEKRPLIYAINQLQAEGETALYEAIRASSLHLRGRSDRRAVVLFTDGQESFYRKDVEGEEKLGEVLETANLAQVNFFAIGYGGDFTAALLTRIAEDTGGRFFPAEGDLRLEQVFGDISTILESQYTLAYYPSPPPPPREWRSIEVRVRPPGLRVRARKGYYSARR